ncbi:trigger factor [Alicyclobacillus cycloheptanicus]|uniref:Trigger factor n=1 Tax=Alicyclobacillus cycloheptanicus TaxID=1457 RepID=A0ABT9XEV8_9BACL|nr:trigger factor [Alicyclobacillus cycloheptanicus]MDQ0188281.1 trigger factor [Alicyclobacillus cycloheptanicus]WDM01000.1 trigger factor [Alicyclobacillus cycloheptanicus]
MTVKWEKTSANVGVLEVEVERDEFAEALDVAFKKIVKRVSVPGFRKGKVPRKIFESRFGVESLYQDAVDYLLPRAYEKAVEESGIDPVAQPSVDVVQVEAGKPFIFKATVTVRPEVQLGEYKGIEIQDKPFEVTDEAVSEEIDRIRESHAEINPVEDGEVEKGDTVSIDFQGTIDGEPFEGGEAENFQLEVGSGMFVAGFEDQLIGMKPGEERDIVVTFPEDYHVKSLASKEASFHVVLHDIKRKSVRELNDEFVQEISEFQTVDEFVADVRKQLEHRAKHDHERYLEDQAVEQAVKNATVEIPDVMIEHEIDHRVSDFAQQLQMQQIPLDEYLEFTGMTQQELRDRFREAAEQAVRTTLVLDAIAKAENLEASDEEVEAELQKIAESAGMPTDRIRQMLGLRDPNLEGFKSDIRTKKTVSFLVEHGKLV